MQKLSPRILLKLIRRKNQIEIGEIKHNPQVAKLPHSPNNSLKLLEEIHLNQILVSLLNRSTVGGLSWRFR